MAQSHQNRIHASVSAFLSASEGMIAALERLNDTGATHTPAGGGWTAAQIGYHVATTNDFLAGILTGATPKAVAAPAGFQENPNVFSHVPAKITTFAVLEPPANVTRAQAISRLRESTAQAVKAIEGLNAERASGQVVEFPFGAISLYQLAEFLGGHVVRHQGQLQRATASV
jgi:DinB superfamily